MDADCPPPNIHSGCIYVSADGAILMSPLRVEDFGDCDRTSIEASIQRDSDIRKQRERQALTEVKKLLLEIEKLYYKVRVDDPCKKWLKQLQGCRSLAEMRAEAGRTKQGTEGDLQATESRSTMRTADTRRQKLELDPSWRIG